MFAGVDAILFWEMTIFEINSQIEAFNMSKHYNAWVIGQYVGCGVNEPKKYPTWSEVEMKLTKQQTQQTDKQMEFMGMNWAIAYGGVIKWQD